MLMAGLPLTLVLQLVSNYLTKNRKTDEKEVIMTKQTGSVSSTMGWAPLSASRKALSVACDVSSEFAIGTVTSVASNASGAG